MDFQFLTDLLLKYNFRNLCTFEIDNQYDRVVKREF